VVGTKEARNNSLTIADLKEAIYRFIGKKKKVKRRNLFLLHVKILRQ